jgi:hypothetical protein
VTKARCPSTAKGISEVGEVGVVATVERDRRSSTRIVVNAEDPEREGIAVLLQLHGGTDDLEEDKEREEKLRMFSKSIKKNKREKERPRINQYTCASPLLTEKVKGLQKPTIPVSGG